MPHIDFITNSKDTLRDFKPVLAKSIMPEWWKKGKIDQYIRGEFVQTIRACPAMDDWTKSGYYIVANRDFKILAGEERIHEEANTIGALDTSGHLYESQSHPKDQMFNTFEYLGDDGPVKDAFKMRNPWNVKTPPGYSTLYLDPFLFQGRAFAAWQGIIDTDKMHVNQDNAQIIFYPRFNTSFTIKKGTPLVQCIPFKREEWHASFQYQDPKTFHENRSGPKEHGGISNEDVLSVDYWNRCGRYDQDVMDVKTQRDERKKGTMKMGPYRTEGYWTEKSKFFKTMEEVTPPPECPMHKSEEE
jgi:hypothetical protein